MKDDSPAMIDDETHFNRELRERLISELGDEEYWERRRMWHDRDLSLGQRVLNWFAHGVGLGILVGAAFAVLAYLAFST